MSDSGKLVTLNDPEFEAKFKSIEFPSDQFFADQCYSSLFACKRVIPDMLLILEDIIHRIKVSHNPEFRKNIKFNVGEEDADSKSIHPRQNGRYDCLRDLQVDTVEKQHSLNFDNFLFLLHFINNLPFPIDKDGMRNLLRRLESIDIGFSHGGCIYHDKYDILEIARLAYNRNFGIFSIVHSYVKRMDVVYDKQLRQHLDTLGKLEHFRSPVDQVVLELLRFTYHFHRKYEVSQERCVKRKLDSSASDVDEENNKEEVEVISQSSVSECLPNGILAQMPPSNDESKASDDSSSLCENLDESQQ